MNWRAHDDTVLLLLRLQSLLHRTRSVDKVLNMRV